MFAKARIEYNGANNAVRRVDLYNLVGRRNLWLIISAALLVRILSMLFSMPIADEAYYWVWSQHPSLSYFDHPLIVAANAYWVDFLFGPSLVGLRASTLLTTLGTILVLRAWCRLIDAQSGDQIFLTSLAFLSVMPGFNLIPALATPEHLLIFFATLTGYLVTQVFKSHEQGKPLPILAVYGAALSLGLAGLTKYYAVLIGLGLIFALLTTRSSRSLFRNPHIWVGGILALVIQIPVFIWNIENDFMSFGFHLIGRHKGDFLSRLHFEFIVGFLAQVIVMTSPIMLMTLWRIMKQPPQIVGISTAWQSSRWTIILSFGVFGLVSLTAPSFGWWMLAGIATAAPLLIYYINSLRAFWFHIGFAMLLSLIHLFSTMIGPITFLIGLNGNPWAIGYPEQNELQARLRAYQNYDFIASTGWQDVSMAGFLIGDANGLALDEKEANAYRAWQDPASRKGQTALVFIRNGRKKNDIAPLFGSFELQESIVVSRFGKKLTRYDLFMGRDFKGAVHPQAASAP